MVVRVMHFPKGEVGVRIGCMNEETVGVGSKRGLHQRTSEESCCDQGRQISPGRLWTREWMHWEASTCASPPLLPSRSGSRRQWRIRIRRRLTRQGQTEARP